MIRTYFRGNNLTQYEMIMKYVSEWSGSPSGMYNSDINKETGLYWNSTNGKFYLYFQTKESVVALY